MEKPTLLFGDIPVKVVPQEELNRIAAADAFTVDPKTMALIKDAQGSISAAIINAAKNGNDIEMINLPENYPGAVDGKITIGVSPLRAAYPAWHQFRALYPAE